MKPLVYDIEIEKAIPSRLEQREAGIVYCDGWHDHANMGITVIGAYDYADGRYRVFCRDNFSDFLTLTMSRFPLVTFNGIAFDNEVIRRTCGFDLSERPNYDLLVETWRAAGLSTLFAGTTHMGYGLDAMCERAFGLRKTGQGALAPVLWQRGQIGQVIDYCLNDVHLTRLLFDRVNAGLPLFGRDFEELRLKHPGGFVEVKP